MVENIKKLLPYANVTKTWLTNLSVGTFAVGLLDGNNFGVIVGTILILFAYVVVFFEEKVRK